MAPTIQAMVSESPPKGYGRSHDILEVAALQKNGDSLRNAALTGFVHPVTWTDFITGPVQIVSELIYYIPGQPTEPSKAWSKLNSVSLMR